MEAQPGAIEMYHTAPEQTMEAYGGSPCSFGDSTWWRENNHRAIKAHTAAIEVYAGVMVAHPGTFDAQPGAIEAFLGTEDTHIELWRLTLPKMIIIISPKKTEFMG